MLGKQRTTISREGAYYALVVVFILGGAALRQVNLLVVFAGLLVAPAIFHWRIVGLTIRRIRVRRRLPAFAHAGRPCPVTVELENPPKRLGAWAVSVEDDITSDAGEVGAGVYLAPYVPPGETTRRAYLLNAPRRGRYHLGPIRVSTQFPFGLFRSTIQFDLPEDLLVLPRLGHLGQRWQALFAAPREGSHLRSGRRQGNEGDFFALREWRSGDSRRWIHWRSTARRNFPVVRQLERPQQREAGVLLDLWAPDDASEEQQGWVEMAVSFAATAIRDFGNGDERPVHVILCGDETFRWRGEANLGPVQAVLTKLALLKPTSSTNIAARISELRERLPADSPIVILSTRPRSEVVDGPLPSSRLHWVEMSSEERSEYFTLEDPRAANEMADDKATEPVVAADPAPSELGLDST